MSRRIAITPEWVYVGSRWQYGHRFPTPAGLLSDPSMMDELIRELGSLWGTTTLLVPVAMPLPTEYRPGGYWKLISSGQWDTYRNDGGGLLRVGHLDGPDPMLHGTPDEVLDRLTLWEITTGGEYVTSPAVAAIANLKSTVDEGRVPVRWKLIGKMSSILAEPSWSPPGQIHDLRHDLAGAGETLFRFDMRAAYLAAATAVELPHAKLIPTGPDVDPTAVGYFHIRTPNRWVSEDGWVCHPTLRLLRDLGEPFEIIDSHTAVHGASRVLRRWAERWRDALTNPACQDLRPMLKQGYAQALGGLLAVPTGTVYRPDWRHMIMDQVRSSVLRRLYAAREATGAWPAKIETDAVFYPVNANLADLCRALGEGPRIGNMRYEGVVVVEELADAPH